MGNTIVRIHDGFEITSVIRDGKQMVYITFDHGNLKLAFNYDTLAHAVWFKGEWRDGYPTYAEFAERGYTSTLYNSITRLIEELSVGRITTTYHGPFTIKRTFVDRRCIYREIYDGNRLIQVDGVCDPFVERSKTRRLL